MGEKLTLADFGTAWLTAELHLERVVNKSTSAISNRYPSMPGGMRRVLPDLVHDTTDGVNYHLGVVKLDVMPAVLRDHLRTAGREVRQFRLHLLPGVIRGLDQVFWEIRLRRAGIVRENRQRHIAEGACGCGLSCALGKCFQFRDSFAHAVKIAFGGADYGIMAAKTHQTRDPQGHGEFQELFIPNPARIQIVQRRRKTFLLLGMRRVNQDHSGNLVPIEAGEEAYVVTAHGVADQDNGTCDAGVLQKCVQLFGHHFACAGTWAGVAVAEAGAIVRANARDLSYVGLHLTPGDITVAQAGVEDYDWASLPSTVDVHLIAANLDQLAGHAIETTVARF